MKTTIDSLVRNLLLEIPENENLDQEIIGKTLEKARKKLNLGAAIVILGTDEKRDYQIRWISAADESFVIDHNAIHIKSKEYKAILEKAQQTPFFSIVLSGRGIKGKKSAIGYSFIRTATNSLDGAVLFAQPEEYKWTEEEKNALLKLGRVLRRALSGEMLLETDIQLKMARTKVEIYRHYTEYDTLTQVPNRHYFVRFCKEYVEKDKRPNVGFLFADLNRLKFINDTMGHPEGDIYITNFAEKLSKCFGAATVCRISGDEFIACTTKDSKEDFEKKVETLINENIYRGVPQASIGYVWREQAENIKDVMNDAESLMYTDKQAFYKKHPEFKR